MPLSKRWAGRVFGTNTGNVFVKLEGEDGELTGTLRINEPGVVAVYEIQGTFEAPTLTLKGQPQTQIEGVEFGEFTGTGKLHANGQLLGDWETTIGTGGTFHLFPHNYEEDPSDSPQPDQHHTARHSFGAIEIDREGITQLAEGLRPEFPSVIVSIDTGTAQARYLDDFKQLEFNSDTAQLVRIFAEKRGSSGANQSVTIEFGQNVNWAMAQGTDEAWVRGKLEMLKQNVRQFERTYVTTYARWGISINQLLLVTALVLLPSFNTLQDRGIFMGTGLALLVGVNWLHSRYLPFAAINLKEKRKGLLSEIGPSTISWFSAIVASVIATIVAAYLLGTLDLDDLNDDSPQIETPATGATPRPQ